MTNGNQGNFFSGKAGNFVSGKETAECPAWGKTHFRMIGMKRLIPLIAIERLTNFQVEMTAKLDYGSTKRMFAELITERFLENKGVKIM